MNQCWTTGLTTGASILRCTTNTSATWGYKAAGSRNRLLHWCGPALEGNTCTTHQKISQPFANCKRVKFRNLRFHPCFEQECAVMTTDFQSFSSSLLPFCPILHNAFQAHLQPFVSPEASHLKLCWTALVPWVVPENSKLSPHIFKHRKFTQKVWTIWPDISRQLSRKQKRAASVQYGWISPRHLTWNHPTGETSQEDNKAYID